MQPGVASLLAGVTSPLRGAGGPAPLPVPPAAAAPAGGHLTQLCGALRALQGTAHGAPAQDGNGALMDAVLTSVLKAMGDQDRSMAAMKARMDSMQEQLAGYARRAEADQRTLAAEVAKAVRQPAAPLLDAGLRQALEAVNTRLHMVELKCEEATTAAAMFPHVQASIDATKQDVMAQQGMVLGRLDMLAAEVNSLKALVATASLHTPPGVPAGGILPAPLSPLRSSIEDVLMASQSLAAKQADCVTVLAQSCQRIDLLEAAVGSTQDVLASLCYSAKDLQTSVEHTQVLLDLPSDLAPHLDGVENRVELLHTRPAFERILARLAHVEEVLQAAAPAPAAAPPPTDARAPSGVDLVSMGDRLRQQRNEAGEAGVRVGRTPLPDLGINRGQLEAADRLVASLAATLSGGCDRGGQSPIRSRSPRAREFRRTTSPSPAAPETLTSPARGQQQQQLSQQGPTQAPLRSPHGSMLTQHAALLQ
eukprot:TRINITY_DN33020_c0_g1_i1.p2 TRINITY_DN33020_c0_g1~~TRINITY_DN33020_c0_g1_i1.p2  ORF type:complete len:479 (+),score=179.02 TRINITY_DN33020_c0_g1_i1:40-1476(+)